MALAAAAAAVAAHDRAIPGFHTWLGIPLAAWLLLAAAATPAVLAARYLMALLVRLLESVAAAVGLTNVHYVLIGVTDALRYAPPPPHALLRGRPAPAAHTAARRPRSITGSMCLWRLLLIYARVAVLEPRGAQCQPVVLAVLPFSPIQPASCP